jgi:hypothetical protein
MCLVVVRTSVAVVMPVSLGLAGESGVQEERKSIKHIKRSFFAI